MQSNIKLDQVMYHRHFDALGDYLLEEYKTQTHEQSLSAGKGLMQQLEEGTVLYYSRYKINREDITNYLEGIFNLNIRPFERKIKLCTGENGMWVFDFTIKYGGTLRCTFIVTAFKKMKKGTYISLFTKRSNFKLYILGDTFKFYHGTKLLKTIHDVTTEWNKANSTGIDDPNIQKKIDMVNNYINDVLTPLYEKENTEMKANTAIDKQLNLIRHNLVEVVVDGKKKCLNYDEWCLDRQFYELRSKL